MIFFKQLDQEENEYDIVMCATGRKVPLEGFERRSLEAQVGIDAMNAFENFFSDVDCDHCKLEELEQP